MFMVTPTYAVTLELPFQDNVHPDPVFIVTTDELPILAGILVKSGLPVFRVRPNHIHNISRVEATEPSDVCR